VKSIVGVDSTVSTSVATDYASAQRASAAYNVLAQ
jgi:hypothetical protein